MKKLISFCLISLFSLSITASDLEAFFNHVIFNSPDGAYVETSITAIGKTFHFKENDNGKLQASMGVTIIFKQDDEIVKFEKYNVTSPEIEKTDTLMPNFIDLQRIKLENGVYELEVSIQDNNSEQSPVGLKDIIAINFDDKIRFSGIQFIESYSETKTENVLSKNGYDMVPYNSDFYPNNMEKLTFYSELYNTSKADSLELVLIKYYIEGSQSQAPLHDYNRFLKKKPSEIEMILGEFKIQNLPSGNYNLVVEVRDKKNRLISVNKKFFFRSNPLAKLNLTDIKTVEIENTFVASITNVDTLKLYIDYLYPISDQNERKFADNVLANDNLEFLQKYFYNFWYKRDALEPEKAWQDYHMEVKKVNSAYKCSFMKGYQTDRGRVYLQYGPPNQIIEEKFTIDGYPYEIWHYYQIENQNNIQFIFYDYMKSGVNYRLLHSDFIGEIQNYNWKSVLRNDWETDPMNSYEKDGIYFPGGQTHDR